MQRLVAGLFLFAVLFSLAGCNEPVSYGRLVDGPYRLYSAGPGQGLYLCYELRAGQCQLRVGGPVIAYGFNEEFISVATAAPEDGKKHREKWRFYFIVRLDDHPDANPEIVVHGPMSERDFKDYMASAHVPSPDQIVAN